MVSGRIERESMGRRPAADSIGCRHARMQSANAALRGPAGLLFANGGRATGVSRWLPDLQVTFQVTPRNLNLDR